MKRIRVLIVEDSAVVREFLTQIVGSDRRLEVAGAVATAEEALAVLDSVAPDVISLDIRLPGIDGLEATRRIMSTRPTPIVVVSATIESRETSLSMQALRAGALSVVEKPPASSHRDYQALAHHLCTQLAIMSEVKLVRQRARTEPARALPNPGRLYGAARFEVVGIAASTGGPSALAEVLGGLGKEFPVPIAMVQHMSPGFVNGFCTWLSGATGFVVETVAARKALRPGHVYTAPPGCHLLVDRYGAWPEDGDPASTHRPSGDALFRSIARSYGSCAIGVLLTGMGDDGALGLREMHDAGAHTIAEDESTAVVYGMPAAAVRLGAACESLPLHAVAARIRALVKAAEEH